MTTSIVFTLAGGIPVPSVSSIAVAAGDTFELSVADESRVVIYFSPALAANLTPAAEKSVTLSPGAPVSFTFLSSTTGAYSMIGSREGDPAPPHFRTAPSSHVSLESNFQSARVAFPVDGGRTSSNN